VNIRFKTSQKDARRPVEQVGTQDRDVGILKEIATLEQDRCTEYDEKDHQTENSLPSAEKNVHQDGPERHSVPTLSAGLATSHNLLSLSIDSQHPWLFRWSKCVDAGDD
jgi:hypothetical protein